MLVYDPITGKICDTGVIRLLEGGCEIMSQKVAALQVAYATLEKKFEEYRKQVERSIGKKKEEALYALAEEHDVSVEDLYKVL